MGKFLSASAYLIRKNYIETLVAKSAKAVAIVSNVTPFTNYAYLFKYPLTSCQHEFTGVYW